MKKYLLIFILFLTYTSVYAQEIIVRVDSATGGKLAIEADEEIIKMIDNKAICKKVTSSTANPGKPKTPGKPTGPTSIKNVCSARNDIPGFMIKIGETKDESEINALMSKFRTLFPHLRVEKSFIRPDWRVLAGDYFKKESAQADLRKVKSGFPSAVVVSWRIYCNRAK